MQSPQLSQNINLAIKNAIEKALCEHSFAFFVRYVFKNYYCTEWLNNWHHDEIIKTIEAIERREIANAVINIPPRYGKTELCVILWICWTLIRNPRAQFMHASYSDDLALKNSAQAREILKSPCIQKHWQLKMRDSADSKGLWLTEQGGGVRAGASATAMTGFGAGVTGWEDGQPFDGAIILDDPLKADDARSEVERTKVNERLGNTFHSRKNHSKVPIVIVMQRLHEDDASAYALSGKVMGEQFYHLKLAALGDDDKPLWSAKHTTDALHLMRTSDPHTFAGQYQQEPYTQGGEVFKMDWFAARYVALPKPPTRTMIVHSWDTAFKKGDYNDPSVCTIWHCTPSVVYLAEVVRGRWDYPELRKMAFDLALRDKPDAVLVEDKASGQTLIQEMQRAGNINVIAMPVDGDKESRARNACAAFVQAGRVVLPESATWLHDLEKELQAFPHGKHDDQVDSVSQFVLWFKERGGDVDQEYKKMMERLYG